MLSFRRCVWILSTDEKTGDSNEAVYAVEAPASPPTVTPPDETTDSDRSGVIDSNITFPNDATEWADSNQDGVGNNANLDGDYDGLPDLLEAQFEFDPVQKDADLAPDDDGISNLDEWLARIGQ